MINTVPLIELALSCKNISILPKNQIQLALNMQICLLYIESSGIYFDLAN